MSGGDKELEFWDAIAHELASDTSEDAEEREEALGADESARSRLRQLVRSKAMRAIGQARRKRLTDESLSGVRRARRSGRYDEMTRAELLAIAAARAGGAFSDLAVQHRGFESASDEDLRSMLEDADALELGDE